MPDAPAFPDGDAPDPLADQSANRAIERGNAVHRLLQALPDTAADQRAEIAGHFLDRRYPDWPSAMREDSATSVLRIMESPAFADLFGMHSRAEVPIAGSIETGGGVIQVAGIVDRIAVLPDRVIVADYKTNARPPTSLDQVPDAYWTQMAVYSAMISSLYPGRAIETVLIWTADARAMLLPPDQLAARLSKA